MKLNFENGSKKLEIEVADLKELNSLLYRMKTDDQTNLVKWVMEKDN